MGFVEVIGGMIVKEIGQIVRDEVKAAISEAMFLTSTYAKYDKQAVELIEEGKNATTLEEKDAVLDKLFEARPKFS